MTWRKKWAKCWDEVKYCSERCLEPPLTELRLILGDQLNPHHSWFDT
jgi:hypothetical protein